MSHGDPCPRALGFGTRLESLTALLTNNNDVYLRKLELSAMRQATVLLAVLVQGSRDHAALFTKSPSAKALLGEFLPTCGDCECQVGGKTSSCSSFTSTIVHQA